MTPDLTSLLRAAGVAAATCLPTLALTLPAAAVQPASWTHTTEADFAAGEIENVVVTNLGDVMLSAGAEPISEAPEDITVFNDLQQIDGMIYIAGGPHGAVLRRDGEAIQSVVTLERQQIFALGAYRNQLLVAISGEDSSRLAILDGEKLQTLAELSDVRYIWDVLVQGDAIIIATGTSGKVLRIEPDHFDAEAEENPGLTELLTARQANILCLAEDGEGRIYAGTDTDGLIYRLTPNGDNTYDPFVLYDAAEPEIGALLVLADGTVYAGTADADQARPGRLGEAAAEQAGRPDVTAPAPADAEAPPEPGEPAEPDLPEPGDLPQVPPGAPPIGDPDGGEMPNVPPREGGGGDDGNDQPTGEEAMGAARRAGSPRQLQASDAPNASHAPSEESPSAEATDPTPQQYDRLRAVIRERLEAARRTGTLQVGPQRPGSARAGAPASGPRVRPPAQATPPREGNAVYRIDPQGFVTEVFRESVMVLRLVRSGGRLLVATGNEGQVFAIDPRAEETTTLVDLEPEQVTAMLPGPDGGIMLTTANPAELRLLGDRRAERGVYTSQVLDAGQISLWGALNLIASVHQDTRLLVETRSGNVANPEQAPWSDWSEPIELPYAPEVQPLQPRETRVQAPPARFLQYRLTLEGTPSTTPVVDEVRLTYVTPNMRPRITSLRTSYPEQPQNRNEPQQDAPPPATAMTIEWEASDPNEDTLVYKLEYQPAGSDQWLLMVENHREPRYEWQTRRVPDGRYLVRVTADDRLSNPPDMAMSATRRSNPILVDNTPPRVEDLEITLDGRQAAILGEAIDDLSPINSIAYTTNTAKEYTPILPTDLIFDSTRERFEVKLSGLSPGAHVVTLRVTDARGNTRYESVLFDVSR